MIRSARATIAFLALLLIGFTIFIYNLDVLAVEAFRNRTEAPTAAPDRIALPSDSSREQEASKTLRPAEDLVSDDLSALPDFEAIFSAMTMRPGLTILGDSYSVNNSANWPAHISSRTMQNVAKQGASVDKRYSLKADLTVAERAEVADDLNEQVAKMRYLTPEVVLWFGINDLMTLQSFEASKRTRAMIHEHRTLFAVIDGLLACGVEHIVVPLTLDFSAAPGVELGRKAHQTVRIETTHVAIEEWNAHILQELRKRERVSTIDFYAKSQDWFTNQQAYGIKYLVNLDDPPELAFVWNDLLHMTPYMHRAVIAPEYETVLTVSRVVAKSARVQSRTV